MDLDLAKRFILNYLPPDAQIPIAEIMEALKKSASTVFVNGMQYNALVHFNQPNRPEAIAAANGFMNGFAMAIAMEDPNVRKTMENYVEAFARIKGKNVINLVEKRKCPK